RPDPSDSTAGMKQMAASSGPSVPTCRPDNVACMGSALLVGLIAVQRNLGRGPSWLQRTNLWRRLMQGGRAELRRSTRSLTCPVQPWLGPFLLGVLGLSLVVLKQRRSATRGGWYESVSWPTICCFSRHDCPSRTVCCDGRGCS